MGRMNIEGARMRDIRIGKGLTMESATFVPADNFVLTVDHPSLLFLNPAGAIDVLMPTSSAARQGLRYTIVNLSANTITLKTDGDAAFTAAIAIASTQMCEVVCTGSATQAVGWRAMTAAGTQTSP
jgi:hypothetical protein